MIGMAGSGRDCTMLDVPWPMDNYYAIGHAVFLRRQAIDSWLRLSVRAKFRRLETAALPADMADR